MNDNGDLNRAELLLAKFPKGQDKMPDYEQFRALCLELFDIDECKQNESVIQNIFDTFCLAENGTEETRIELKRHFKEWISIVLSPVNVLLIVDVQNDFIDGALALRNCGCGDGADVIEPINHLISKGNWNKIIYSLDWHPENHISFYDNLCLRELHPDSEITKEAAKLMDTVLFKEPLVEQKLWPRHCVMNTWGAELHKDLVISADSVQVKKGQDPDKESYSVFLDNNTNDSAELLNVLSKEHATDVYVCGLAYDVCVRETCLDGLRLGYRVVVIDDCCRGVENEGIAKAKELIKRAGGLITTSKEVFSLINGKRRSLQMARQSANFLIHAQNGINSKNLKEHSQKEHSIQGC